MSAPPIPTNANAGRQPGDSTLQNGFSTATVFPKPQTVKGRVLGAMLRGERLTHLDCWKRFGSSRLSHHIWDLRRDGWPVNMVSVDVTTSDAGRHATIGVYSLLPLVIDKAGEFGRQYATECLHIERERRAA